MDLVLDAYRIKRFGDLVEMLSGKIGLILSSLLARQSVASMTHNPCSDRCGRYIRL